MRMSSALVLHTIIDLTCIVIKACTLTCYISPPLQYLDLSSCPDPPGFWVRTYGIHVTAWQCAYINLLRATIISVVKVVYIIRINVVSYLIDED